MNNPLPLSNPLALLQQRRSVPARQLGEPAPDPATLETLLEAAIRVPDHGKLVPFRLILLRGEAKLRFGERLAEVGMRNNPEMTGARLQKERRRYTFAPLVIAVIARIDAEHKVPEIEQKLCAGNVAHNLLLGAYALGYGAQWVTGWAAYDPTIRTALRIADHERVVGFIHVGTAREAAPERLRPALADLLSEWQG